MKAIISNNISITLATIIGNAILPNTGGSIEARHLEALERYPAGYKKIVENRKEILAMGNMESATVKAKEILAA